MGGGEKGTKLWLHEPKQKLGEWLVLGQALAVLRAAQKANVSSAQDFYCALKFAY